MAETKKTKTAKKKESKTTPKSSEKKTKVTKAASNKEHKTTKAVHEKKVEETSSSSNNTYKILAIVLGVLFLLAVIGMAIMFSKVSNLEKNMASGDVAATNNSNLNVGLVVISDPNCKTCDVESFVSDIKNNLIPNLKVEYKNLEDKFSKNVIEDTNAMFVPIYLFSKELENLPDFETKIAGAFIKKNYDGKDYYMLNPQYVPSKLMLSEPEIKDFALVYGDENAPVTVYEFSDYECPFCAIAEGNDILVQQFSTKVPGYEPPMPNLFKDYIETGKVKLVFYNMPLEGLHPNVRPAHLASICVYKQDKDKWKTFSQNLFKNRDDWINGDVKSKVTEYAKDLGVDMDAFNKCMEDPATSDMIDQSIKYGASLGVSGTPAFFVGKNFISGAQDYKVFKDLIDKELGNN
jgi:protein-disulfide isomerase